MSDQLFYVVSVKHTHRSDPYITLWAPDDKGYRYRTESAGRYTEAQIAGHLDYYHSGHSDIAVKCEVLDAIVVMSEPGYLDTAGFVVPNNSSTWFDIIYQLAWPTKNKPEPQFRGARRRKEAV